MCTCVCVEGLCVNVLKAACDAYVKGWIKKEGVVMATLIPHLRPLTTCTEYLLF